MKNRLLFIPPLLLLGAGLLVVAAHAGWWWFGARPPRQPVSFRHDLHAGKVGLACTACHRHAAASRFATIPSVTVCAGCHRTVAVDRPAVRELMAYARAGSEPPWRPVYRLPWHAGFSHKRHVGAGVECAWCHGPVQAMRTMRRLRTLEMGWCVTCHRRRGAPDDCLTCHR